MNYPCAQVRCEITASSLSTHEQEAILLGFPSRIDEICPILDLDPDRQVGQFRI